MNTTTTNTNSSFLSTSIALAAMETTERPYGEPTVTFTKAEAWKMAVVIREQIKAQSGVFLPCNTWGQVRTIGHYGVLMATTAEKTMRITPSQRTAVFNLFTGASKKIAKPVVDGLVRRGLAATEGDRIVLTAGGTELALSLGAVAA